MILHSPLSALVPETLPDIENINTKKTLSYDSDPVRILTLSYDPDPPSMVSPVRVAEIHK